ncbi:aerobic respiration two-component sensor histidine kinase ArcB [Candidatus Enterovibrio altilux]|uniref:aerobic respiration two-component sensor histidine kinase ArcB n=1 Tax=Candidatus Enterovibrio altilux TaxID=1927128 RepID=UPI000BBCAFD4|nr:aerobic respiration two-component sensor histidine kinase ArcB [Candidatus Enterovibrio luxaltus]
MKQIKLLAQYYVNLLVKLGIVRFSMLLALALIALAVVVQVTITLVLNGSVHDNDILRFVIFGLLITPWAVYFLSVVVDQLEKSRQHLTTFIEKLEEMRFRDMELNRQLTYNVEQLNQEIEERKRAEVARKAAILSLKKEVHRREKAQLELAEQTALLRSFIDASPDLIYYRNEKGKFSGCNKAMEDLTGKRESELVGLTPWDIYSKDIASKVVETDQQVFDNNVSLTYEQWLIYSDGQKAYFELRKLPFYSQDGFRLGLVGFGREITERKRYQDELEKVNQDKIAFISTISHELRTPLNGIVGLSRMLLDTRLSCEQSDYLRTIHVSAITLGNIFNDIIDLDKYDRSKLELVSQPIDLLDFMTEIENISGLMAEQQGLRFSLDKITLFPPSVMLDATRLRQILWNLVGNAVKFTKQGIVNVVARCNVKDNIAHLQFDVGDSGIGIPLEEQNKIFAMYYQVQQEENNLHAVGTGIGLAVSRKLARLMGGDIVVDSKVGEGSTFTVTLGVPLSEPSKDIGIIIVEQIPLKILLVEDIELNITVTVDLLEGLGHTVIVARCGKKALEILPTTYFDLLLLDIQLPDMTGFDIVKVLRDGNVSLPPLVALTANVIKDKTEYIARGMDDAISKPISVSAVVDVIERLVMQCHFSKEQTVVLGQKRLNNNLYATLLDLEMLSSYVDIVGPVPVYKSIIMFEKLMPEYLQILGSNVIAKDQRSIASKAHQIKSAACSIGLKHIQKVAQKAQSPDLPAWWENITDWVDEIQASYSHDLGVLKQWLNEYKK